MKPLARVALVLIAVASVALLWSSRPNRPSPEGRGSQASAPPPEPFLLEPGDLVDSSSLKPGQIDLYRVRLAGGQFAEVLVEQRGADVVARLRDSHGRELLRMDSPNGHRGPERLHLLAEEAGSFTVEVAGSEHRGGGSYSVSVVRRLPAGSLERTLAEGALAFERGETLRRQGGEEALRAALAAYRKALTAWRSGADPYGEALTLHRSGQVLDGLGRKEEALEFYRESAGAYKASAEPWGEGIVLNQVGALSRLSGRLKGAIEAYERAQELFAALGERRAQGVVLNNLGLTHKTAGSAYEALDAYHRALDIWRQLGVDSETANTLNNLGNLYLLTGRLDLALDVLQEALPLQKAAGSPEDQAAVLNSLGFVYLRQGEPETAAREFQEALTVMAGPESPAPAPVSLLGLAATELERGAAARARSFAREALEVAQRLADGYNQAAAYFYLGWAAREEGALEESLAAYQQALPIARSVGAREVETSTLFGIATCLRLDGRLDAARRSASEALDRVESIHWRAGSRGLQDSFLASRRNYYEFLIDLLMELEELDPEAGHAAAALEVSERSRARGLIETLAGRELLAPGVAAATLVAEERRLGERLEAKELERLRLVEKGPAAEDLAGIERELRSLTVELHQLEARIRRESPSYASLTRPRPLDLAGIREQVLDAETVLLEYSLGAERSFLWMVSPEDLRFHVLPGRQELERLARRTYSRLTESHLRGGRVEWRLSAARLGEVLLGPVASRLEGRRLLVVAEGALQYVPFAVLLSPATGRPLVEDHEIITVASASVMGVLRRQLAGRESPPRALAVLADPDFGESGASTTVDQASSLLLGDSLGALPRLPHSRDEAEAILALVDQDQRLGALGAAANLDLVWSGELARYRIVHFATHGQLNTEHPELSRLVLSLVDAGGRPRDGVLWGHQTYNLDLPADLVVLSACRTALGKQVRGEGMMSLTRGFMHAGAARVVVSLWNVSDRATAVLMERFYRGMLRDGLTPAAALRQAQTSMLREQRWSAPYHWAGFLLQGEWR